MMNYDYFTELDYEHIFIYYDMPLFFVLSDPETNDLYLFYLIDDIDSVTEKWFYSRITRLELNYLLSKRTGVLSFINNLYAASRLYYLFINHSEKTIKDEVVKVIIKDELPLEEFYVDFDYHKNKVIDEKFIYEVNSQEVDIVIRDQDNSHSVDVNTLTSTLETFSDIFDTINKGFSSLKVSAFYPSSFGVKLIATDDLINSSNDTIEKVFIMMDNIQKKNIGNIRDNLIIDKAYNLETLNKARKFANLINKENISIEIKTNDTIENSIVLNKNDKDKFESLKSIMKEFNPDKKESISVEGILTSINTNRNRFSILGYDEIKYSGKLQKELKDSLTDNQFIVPAYIKTSLLKIESFDFDKNDYKITYEMQSYIQDKH